ncbi:MAG: hypothetical protein HQL25_08570 [Candidatus Omnitrophica bacterium]|nr:hypothetical protein [Candidatus Omnitrophota bacterium]
MKFRIIILFMLLVLSGCSVTSKPKIPTKIISNKMSVTALKTDSTGSMVSSIPNASVQKPLSKGSVFAKTDFEGILKTTYVKLVFVNVFKPSEEHILIVGDKSKQNPLGGSSETVEPGYFFIELPVGQYRIINAAIPVGSSLAEEKVDVGFEVVPSKVNYIGTLHMIGTKEKIKFGGIPVVKPGFDYSISIIDEREEGLKMFALKYPDKIGQFIVNLMKINIIQEGDKQ